MVNARSFVQSIPKKVVPFSGVELAESTAGIQRGEAAEG
jgi:hypothetical protein